jgi:serine/threonine protein kinase
VGSERRFTLKRELGSGAFGTVYLAEMESMGGFKKDVAVKLLNESISNFADASKRLRDEARLLGRLQHRNIVRVDDLLRLDGRWAIVMEYIQGYDLELIIQARVELEEEMGPVAVMEVVVGVAGALDAAWSSKAGGEEPLRVVHRDIKPSNIRLTHSGEVKVLDFGIARAEFSGRESETGQLRYGSLGYLSPERLIGEPEVPAGDVFAVGCVAYELLVGEAFGRVMLKPEAQVLQVKSALQRVRAKLEGQPLEAVEQWLNLLEGCLAYEVDDRPTSGVLALGAKTLAKQFVGEALHVFSERALAKLPQVYDDQTRPAQGVLTEEGVTTEGNSVSKTDDSNLTQVFEDFASDQVEAAEVEGDVSVRSVEQGDVPVAKAENPQSAKKGLPPWIVGAAALLVIGLLFIGIGVFSLAGSGAERVVPELQIGPTVNQIQPLSEPVVNAEHPEPTPKEEPPMDPSTESVVPAPVEHLAVDKTPVKPRLPKTDSVPESAGPRLRSAKFSVPGASSVSVTCGDVSGSGSGSALLRELPAGNCSVRAEVGGLTLKGSAKVVKPRGITCTPVQGALTCR